MVVFIVYGREECTKLMNIIDPEFKLPQNINMIDIEFSSYQEFLDTVINR